MGIANELERSLVGNKEVTRHNFDVDIPVSDMVNYYMPAFESCVKEGKALGVMCSYNRVNGTPMCANKKFLTDILRRKWKFDGYVTTDCWAVNDIFGGHLYLADATASAAAAVEAGTDLECGSSFDQSIVQAVTSNLLDQAKVDQALQNLVRVQMRLGLWDNKANQRYFDQTQYGLGQIDTAENRQLALDAALQSIVLLKNSVGVLPLKTGISLALLGPHVHCRGAFLSSYHGERCPSGNTDCIKSPFEAIRAANSGGTTSAAEGAKIADNRERVVIKPDSALHEVDAIVLLMGMDRSQEREDLDRAHCGLTGGQPDLLDAAAALGKPTVLVLLNG